MWQGVDLWSLLYAGRPTGGTYMHTVDFYVVLIRSTIYNKSSLFSHTFDTQYSEQFEYAFSSLLPSHIPLQCRAWRQSVSTWSSMAYNFYINSYALQNTQRNRFFERNLEIPIVTAIIKQVEWNSSPTLQDGRYVSSTKDKNLFTLCFQPASS